MFSANVFEDPAINLLAIIAMVICICIHRTLISGVCKHQYLNAIEYSFLVNIILLSSSALYTIRNSNGRQDIVAYISAGIAFATFIAIILYHLYYVIKCSHILKWSTGITRKLFHRVEYPSNNQWNDQHPHIEDHEAVPVNRADIQPLVVDLNELREPLELTEYNEF